MDYGQPQLPPRLDPATDHKGRRNKPIASLRTYYELTKPGIIYGNALNAAAGFLLAARGHIKPGLFLAMLAGTSLIIASACVFNNYLDRGVDAKMERTKGRALASGQIAVWAAMVYAVGLSAAGFWLLERFTNDLTAGLGGFGLVSYVIFYGWAKRRTVHGTVIGSLPGAVPPVAGYTAVTGHIDGAAIVLFVILVCWQMPHFYAIAMYRLKDYRAAGLPVLPVVKGMAAAKRQIMAYIAVFTAATLLLTLLGYTGYAYLVLALGLGMFWLRRGWHGYSAADSAMWARKMFFTSLIIIVGLDILLAVGPLLP